MPPRAQITGHRFGYLTVISPAQSRSGKSRWNVRCDCGAEFEASYQALKDGDRVSCGCMAHLKRHKPGIFVPGEKHPCHPLVKWVWRKIREEQTTAEIVAKRAGLHQNTIRNWRTKRSPRLADIEAVVNVLGYRLRTEEME